MLVLHEGKVLEFEKPSTLLANESSSFFKLCAASGRRELKILKKMAEGGKAKAGQVLLHLPIIRLQKTTAYI